MSLLSIPNELLLQIAAYPNVKTLSRLARVSYFFNTLLAPIIHDLASQPVHGTPALIWAAQKGHEQLVKILLEKPCTTINAHGGPFWDTALHAAAYWGHEGIVQALLGRGKEFDINAQNRRSQTALHIAIDRQYLQIIVLLVEGGIDVNVKDSDGETALHIAARTLLKNSTSFPRVYVISLLSENGADMDAKNEAGMTALHYAAERGITDLGKALVECGADIEVRDGIYNSTALYFAAGRSDDMSEMLIAMGAAQSYPLPGFDWGTALT